MRKQKFCPSARQQGNFLRLFMACFAMLVAGEAMAQTVTYPECQTLAEYIPQAGVEYQSGVDVHGNNVVPADLNAAPIEMPDIMAIPLSFDLAQRLPDPPQGMKADASVGFLEVHKDGRIVFEGRDLTPQVYAICRGEALPAETGQEQAEPVGSAPINEADRYN